VLIARFEPLLCACILCVCMCSVGMYSSTHHHHPRKQYTLRLAWTGLEHSSSSKPCRHKS